MTDTAIRLGVAGLGMVGRTLVQSIRESLPDYRLVAVSSGDGKKARSFLDGLGLPVPVLASAELGRHADVVVECAPAAVFEEIARPVLETGGTLVALSAGALLSSWHLVEVARNHSGRILVPSGALLALDAVQAAAEGTIHSVEMVTHKPVAGLVGAPYLVERGVDLSDLREPQMVFRGTAREAAHGFPANLNVSVALSLAGIGPDRTSVEIWADPGARRNRHRIVVDSDSARMEFAIENIPSANPKTGRLTALSVLALLRKDVSPLRVGT